MFRRLVDEAKAQHNISDVAERYTALKPRGHEKVGLCPFHQERSPSFEVNDAKGTYHCHGCGVGGDIVRLVREKEGLGFLEALAWLGASDLPMVDPAARARAAAEDAAARAAAIDEARAVWAGAAPGDGTPAQVYLRSRGIVMPVPPTIRFARVHAWRDKETGEPGPLLPALVAAVTDAGREIVAIQRIFLARGGRAKASMRKPKLSMGRVRGGALRLEDPTNEAAQVIITEGPEDALSLKQELPGKRRVWACLGTAMMPELTFPSEVASVVIAGQNDAAGRGAVDAAAARLAEQGMDVRTMFPAPEFKDWNDQLRGITK